MKYLLLFENITFRLLAKSNRPLSREFFLTHSDLETIKKEYIGSTWDNNRFHCGTERQEKTHYKKITSTWKDLGKFLTEKYEPFLDK